MTTELPITASETTFSAQPQVHAYLARPANITSAPALILIHEWWGLNPHIKEIADRFAAAGFITVAIDLYDGVTTKDAAEAGKLMSSLDPGEALAKLETVLDHLRSSSDVTKVGVTGFCMGGVYTLLTACNYQVEAAVPFYGIPDELSCIANLSCPVLFFGGEKDQWITVEKMNRLSEAFQQYGKDGEVKIYDGADHAFFNDTRPEVYNAEAAQDAWQRALTFFRQHLQ
ncbi:MAG: dienelactone hydrolase family protein [Acidobacteria bacterium]|jgi:carboxymethylenebutenolidase|nr:dienelactone hydrolase family protein [Acidobacteriota bacterium]